MLRQSTIDFAIVAGSYSACVVSGLLVVCRALFGPFGWVNSPLNAEAVFALAILWRVLSIRGGDDRPVRLPVDWLAVASVAAVVFVAFAASSDDYFLSDDFVLLRQARQGAFRLGSYVTGGGDGFFRPLAYESFRWNWAWAGDDPRCWHWISFGLHAANSMLVLLLARAIELGRFAAWFAAALFAIHATHPETVVWIAGRFDLLATLFVLLSLVLFLEGHEWVALAAMTAGLLCKESAYACPLLLALIAPRRWRALAPFFTIAAVSVLYRFWLFGNIGGYKTATGQPQALSLGVVSVVKALALRLWAVLFFPVNWSIPPGVLVGIGVAAYVGALVWLVRPGPGRCLSREFGVAIGFVIVAALPPVQQLLIGMDLQKARYLYLPSVGFCLLVAILVQQRRTIAIVILAFNAIVLFHNLQAWHAASALAKDTCAEGSARPPGSLHGVYLFQNGFEECRQMAVK